MTSPAGGSDAACSPDPAPNPGAGGRRLLLFSRRGCCLCEGLEERLAALPCPLPLQLLDVDADPALEARYGLRVPVLAVLEAAGGPEQAAWRELPAVPPRLAGERLLAWLASHGAVGGAAAWQEPGPAAGS